MIADRAANGAVATLNKPYEVVDSAALTVADGGFDKYYSIGMGAGAVFLDVLSAPIVAPPQIVNNAEVPYMVTRVDMDFAIAIKGVAWDSANGGANPAVATTLATTSNWDPTYDDHRQVKLVVAEHNASTN